MRNYSKGDRVQTLIYTLYAGAPGLTTKRIKSGTVVGVGLVDMVGGPEVKILWDGDHEPCSENPNELDPLPLS